MNDDRIILIGARIAVALAVLLLAFTVLQAGVRAYLFAFPPAPPEYRLCVYVDAAGHTTRPTVLSADTDCSK